MTLEEKAAKKRYLGKKCRDIFFTYRLYFSPRLLTKQKVVLFDIT